MGTEPPVAAADDLDPLTRIAIRCGTDKWGAHFYTPVYHALFAHLREKPIRLLEIGIGGYSYTTVGGASLRMWAEYFPQARIVGIDISPKTLQLDPRISTLVGSQTDTAFLNRVNDEHGPFDIVIDDGSHVPAHVTASFHALFPRLADRGLYVIEDVQTTFWPRFGGSLLDGGATMKLMSTLTQFINHAEIAVDRPQQIAAYAKQVLSVRALHNIIVVEKGDNSEPSNAAYSLSNPHAQRAVCAITQEYRRDPNPDCLANLVEVLRTGNDLAQADALAIEGLARWPGHTALLAAACDVADLRGELPKVVGYLERLVGLEPGNDGLKQMYERARSALPAGAR